MSFVRNTENVNKTRQGKSKVLTNVVLKTLKNHANIFRKNAEYRGRERERVGGSFKHYM